MNECQKVNVDLTFEYGRRMFEIRTLVPHAGKYMLSQRS